MVLLPAWPCHWNVDFTLSAPRNTSITGRLLDGKLTYAVTPASRSGMVKAWACKNISSPPSPTPPGGQCNETKWSQICPPTPHDPAVCMKCCGDRGQELIRMHCIGTDVWPHHCSGQHQCQVQRIGEFSLSIFIFFPRFQ